MRTFQPAARLREGFSAGLGMQSSKEAQQLELNAVATGGGAKRIKGDTFEKTILEIIGESKTGLSCASVMQNAKMVALYQTINKDVPQQAQALAKLVREKKLDKSGEARESL